ncbi:MAG: hypothetical protein Q3979_10260, partial [Actinomycetaceae bacterium]|nr:hypothetical protein [Actinomycetaceae bacterium]
PSAGRRLPGVVPGLAAGPSLGAPHGAILAFPARPTPLATPVRPVSVARGAGAAKWARTIAGTWRAR